jgi:nitrogen regulatory protein P-II 2
MKKIDAIVRTSRFDDIVNRLRLIGVTGVTLSEVYGISAGATGDRAPHGRRVAPQSAPRYQFMVVVRDEDAAQVVNAIVHSGRTDVPGDGIVTVADVIGAMRIRTGETDLDAL